MKRINTISSILSILQFTSRKKKLIYTLVVSETVTKTTTLKRT